jgi:hypothetical protein
MASPNTTGPRSISSIGTMALTSKAVACRTLHSISARKVPLEPHERAERTSLAIAGSAATGAAKEKRPAGNPFRSLPGETWELREENPALVAVPFSEKASMKNNCLEYLEYVELSRYHHPQRVLRGEF